MGYHRADGQVGTRNYWLVIPLVFCENRNIRALQEAFEKELGISSRDTYRQHVADLVKLYREGKTEEIRSHAFPEPASVADPVALFPNLDGIRFLTHDMGCGGTRDDAQTLCGLMAGYLHHPNVAGATVLSLGCQNAEVSILQEEIRRRDPQSSKPVLIFDSNKVIWNRRCSAKQSGRPSWDWWKQSPTRHQRLCPAFTVGLSRGSDGFSGITANPAIGYLSDLIAALGGKSILSNFRIVRCRAESYRPLQEWGSSRQIYQPHANLRREAEAVGSGFDMNPSPGNIKDGLITDAMKSAGAARKGGTSPVSDVLDYPQYTTAPGLNLLCTPGNDVEAVTAQVGAGANIVLFTTCLGTPTGNPIAPVVKLSTNSELASRMHDIIDIDTGGVISKGTTIEQMVRRPEQVMHCQRKDTNQGQLKPQEDFIRGSGCVDLTRRCNGPAQATTSARDQAVNIRRRRRDADL
jgi:altronate hydrolase